MSEFYSPNLLFRQNAMRISPNSSPNSSLLDLPEQIFTPIIAAKPAPWLTSANPKDTEIIDKSCSLNRLNIKSNYWKIPDNNMNLTAMDIANKKLDDPILAISSGNKLSNLFIYQFDIEQNYLTHNNTISLPNIHSMKWVPQLLQCLLLNLATGNSGGYAHLLSIPEPESIYENAEIIKKFNHKKYLKDHTPVNVDKLNFLTSTELVTLYKGNLFRWDTSSPRSKPVAISTIHGIRNFDVIPSNESTLAISGDFGVSLFDTRQSEFRVPSQMSSIRSRKQISANVIKWSPVDENVFAAANLDGVVRLWDVRKQEYFGQLDGHNNKLVTSIEWNNDDIFTGAKDGNIIHWDLSDTVDDLTNCTLKEGLSSVYFNPKLNSIEEKVNQRQCGTILPASNTNINCMTSIITDDGDCRVLSIDGSSFFGVHSKIYEAISFNSEGSIDKLYYSQEDLSLLSHTEQTSVDTLVDDDCESVIRPLNVKQVLNIVTTRSMEEEEVVEMEEVAPLTRKPTLLPAVNENMSKETLIESELIDSKSIHSIITEDELNFTSKLQRFTIHNGNSVGSSPQTAREFSDNESLSTNPTIHESEDGDLFEKQPNSPKRDFSFNFKQELII